MVSRGFTSREFAGRSSFGIKLANPSDTMLAWSVHRLFLFKAFQLSLVTYPHTVVLETLIDNVKLKFFLPFCFVELLRIYVQLFRWYFSHSWWKNGHPLLGLSSKVFLYFWFVRSSFLDFFNNLAFFFWLNGQKTIKIDAWVLS